MDLYKEEIIELDLAIREIPIAYRKGDFQRLKSMLDRGYEIGEAALKYADTLMSKNHFALRLTKEAINMNIDAGGLEQALNIEDRNQILLTTDMILKMSKTEKKE